MIGVNCKHCQESLKTKLKRSHIATWAEDVINKIRGDYETHHSHSHCYETTNPPCGQKIPHLYCCVCELMNPEVKESIAEEFKEFQVGLEYTLDKQFPKGKCQERGQALVLFADAIALFKKYKK